MIKEKISSLNSTDSFNGQNFKKMCLNQEDVFEEGRVKINNFFQEEVRKMRTITIIMAICLMALIAVPAITPVGSIGNSAFADDPPYLTNCPSCHAWVEMSSPPYYTIAVLACLPQDAYYFNCASVIYVENPEPPFELIPVVTWHRWLLEVANSNRCDYPCHEYTARYNIDFGEGAFLKLNEPWFIDSDTNPGVEICGNLWGY